MMNFKFGREFVKNSNITIVGTTITREMVSDLLSYHHVDAESELTALLLEEIRREINSRIINNLVSVQPMTLPRGEIFYLDFKYNNKQTFKFGRTYE